MLAKSSRGPCACGLPINNCECRCGVFCTVRIRCVRGLGRTGSWRLISRVTSHSSSFQAFQPFILCSITRRTRSASLVSLKYRPQPQWSVFELGLLKFGRTSSSWQHQSRTNILAALTSLQVEDQLRSRVHNRSASRPPCQRMIPPVSVSRLVWNGNSAKTASPILRKMELCFCESIVGDIACLFSPLLYPLAFRGY